MTDITCVNISNDEHWYGTGNGECQWYYWDGSRWVMMCGVQETNASLYLAHINTDQSPEAQAADPYTPSAITVTLEIDAASGELIPASPLQLMVLAVAGNEESWGWDWDTWGDPGTDTVPIIGLLEFDIGQTPSGSYQASTELSYPTPPPGDVYTLFALRFAAGSEFGPETVFITEILDCGVQAEPCLVKPTRTTFSAGDAGVPGDPGDPGYPPYCVTITASAQTVSGDGGTSTRCTYVFVPGYCDPDAPFGDNSCEESVEPGALTGTYRRLCYPSYGSNAAGTFGRVLAPEKPQLVCYPGREPIPPVPGIPPTPASMAIDYDEGWNYGDELGIVSRNFEFSFQVPVGAGGVVVGLTELLGNAGYLYTKYDHGFYVTSNTYQVIESGVNKSPYIEYASDDVFKIRREAGVITYLVNDVVIHESLKESLSQHVMASYVMYRGGDTLCAFTTATLPNNGVAESVFLLLEGLAADKAYGEGDGVLPLLTSESSGRMTESVYSVLPTITGVATNKASYAVAHGELPSPMTSYSVTGLRLSEIATAVGVLWSMQTWSYGQSGGVGTGDADLPMLATLASDYEYAYGDGSLQPMLAFSRDYWRFDSYLAGYLPGLEIDDFYASLDWLNYLVGDLDVSLEGNLSGGVNLTGTLGRLEVMVLTGTVENVGRIAGDLPALTGSLGVLTGVAGEIEGQLPVQLTGHLYGGAYVTGGLPILTGLLGADVGAVGVLHGDLPALEIDSLTATLGIAGALEGDLPALEMLWGYLDGEILAVEGEFLANTVTVSEYVAWVMNLAHRGVTTYSAFPFEFLIRWQGRHLMANASGVYELDGSGTREGPIAASFRFPPNGFGTMQHKRPARAYLQGSLTGEMAVAVGADEGELYENHTSGHEGIDYWPVPLPRGVKGNHLEFEVSNVDGADFELESVDLLVHLTGRKL